MFFQPEEPCATATVFFLLLSTRRVILEIKYAGHSLISDHIAATIKVPGSATVNCTGGRRWRGFDHSMYYIMNHPDRIPRNFSARALSERSDGEMEK